MEPDAPTSPMTRIGPGQQPFTLDEIRGHVADLILEFQDEPGVELLGFVAAMLQHAQCTCAPATGGHDATVFVLPQHERCAPS